MRSLRDIANLYQHAPAVSIVRTLACHYCSRTTALGTERERSLRAIGPSGGRGSRATIIGRPNAGKSSLLNQLLGRDRATFSAIPGTTRDTIGVTANIMVETLFGQMARTFLRGMRVASWQDMEERILRGVAEINGAPVAHRWSNFTALETQL